MSLTPHIEEFLQPLRALHAAIRSDVVIACDGVLGARSPDPADELEDPVEAGLAGRFCALGRENNPIRRS